MALKYRKNREDVNFIVGGIGAHDKLFFGLIEYCAINDLPMPLDYVFGSLPNCSWSGGRIDPRIVGDIDQFLLQLCGLISQYNDYGIGVRMCFSSPLITEEHLNNEIGVKFLERFNKITKNKLNGVIVSSDLLADMIKENYPNLMLISSTVKSMCENGPDYKNGSTPEYFNKLAEKYDIVVVEAERCIEDDFLEQLKYRDKMEFIVNHKCVRYCPLQKNHYERNAQISQAQANEDDELEESLKKEYEDVIFKGCSKLMRRNPLDSCSVNNDVVDKLISMGFRNFKLEGRENHIISMLHEIIYYIFDESCRAEALCLGKLILNTRI